MRAIVVAVTLPALFGASVALHGVMEERHPQFRVRPNDAFYLPRGDLLRATSLGFHQLAADLMWVKVVQAVGDHATRLDGYRFLTDYVELVTDIDPRNAPAYFIASHWLTAWGETDEAIEVLKKGRERFRGTGLPDYHKFPYYIGLDYFLWKRDREKAIVYLKEAAELMRAKGNGSSAALDQVTAAAENENDLSYGEILETFRGQASSPGERAALEPLMRHGYFYDMVKTLNPLVARYRDEFGEWPESLEKLVEVGWISHVPSDPYGEIIVRWKEKGLYIDDQGQVRSRARPVYWWETTSEDEQKGGRP